MKNYKNAFTLSEALIVLGIIAVISTLGTVAVSSAKPDQSIIMFRRANSTMMKTLKDMANDDVLYPNFVTISSSETTTTTTCSVEKPTKISTPSCTRPSSEPTKPTAASKPTGYDAQVTRMNKVNPSTCTGDYGDAMSARGWFSSTSVSCTSMFSSEICNFSSSLRSAVVSFNNLWYNNNGCCTICGGTANYTLTGSNVSSLFTAWNNVVTVFNSALSSYNSQVSNTSSSLWTSYNSNVTCYNLWQTYDSEYAEYLTKYTAWQTACGAVNNTTTSSVYFVNSASGEGFTDVVITNDMRTQLPYMTSSVSESNKFAVSFMNRLNPITSDIEGNKVTFTTPDGIQWEIIDKFNATEEVAFVTVIVTKTRDTNDGKNACLYNATSCKTPNKFIFMVERSGKVTPVTTASKSASLDKMACTYIRYPRINKQSKIPTDGNSCF